MSAAWVALIGTCVGALLSYAFQRLNMGKAAQKEHEERLRTERIAAYSEFAGILFNFRRAQIRRYNIALSKTEGAELQAAEDESRALRAQAWTALLRVKLLTDDAQVSEKAEHALTLLRQIGEFANSVGQLDHQANLARDEIEMFIETAKETLGS
jgi:hypothetical protein